MLLQLLLLLELCAYQVEAPCERTNVPNIFCIGDLIQNRLELTPVAKVAHSVGQLCVNGCLAGCWKEGREAVI